MRPWNGEQVLLTGAAGFIGANLARELVRQGAELHALVRHETDLWRLEEISSEVRLHRADLRDAADLEGAVRSARPEIIFHLAAPGGHPSGPRERRECLETNVLGTANLLKALEPMEVRRFVHAGSSLEYGPRNRPLRESDRCEPVTHRGAAKAAASLLCLQLARSTGRPLVVLRIFSVYGPWEQPGRLVPTAVRAALTGETMDLTGPGICRDLVYVEDVLEAFLLAARAEVAPGEIINVGSGRQWDNHQVVEKVEAISGRRIRARVGAFPRRPPDTAHWVADTTQARRLLGWEARHSLSAGLEKTVRWFRTHLRAYDEAVLDGDGKVGSTLA